MPHVLIGKKRKGLGLEDSIKSVIEVVFFVATIGGCLLMVAAYLAVFETTLAKTYTRLDATDSAYMIDSCLRGDNHYIDSVLLYSMSQQDVSPAESCGIERDGLGVVIEDLENGEKWDFDPSLIMFSADKHSIFVDIKFGDEIHAGRLTTKLMSEKDVQSGDTYDEKGMYVTTPLGG